MLLPYSQFRWENAILTAALAAPAIAAIAVDGLLRRVRRRVPRPSPGPVVRSTPGP